MSFDTSWNVDNYINEHEPRHHWNLRRSFMLAHKHKFPEERLVCLAQTFANMEFMGCRYPTETMQQVAELSVGIVEKYRENQKGKLQRTFVSGSDAAGAKVNRRPGQKRMGDTSESPTGSEKVPKQEKSSCSSLQYGPSFTASNSCNTLVPEVTYGPTFKYKAFTKGNKGSSGNSESDRSFKQYREQKCQERGYTDDTTCQSGSNLVNNSEHSNLHFSGDAVHFSKTRPGSSSEQNGTNQRSQQQKGKFCGKPVSCNDLKPEDPLAEFVIIEKTTSGEDPIGVLNRSSVLSKLKLEWNFVKDLDGYRCEVKIENIPVASAVALTTPHARRLASKVALDSLRKKCYVIKVKSEVLSDGSTIGLSSIDGVQESSPLEQNSIGGKLLKMMGWAGGGLGKDGEGILEPIRPMSLAAGKRSGLGSTDTGRVVNIRQKLKPMIEQYAASNSPHDLVFSSEFNSDDRKHIHILTRRYNLKSKSYGKGNSRFLVISKKFSLKNVVRDLRAHGGLSERYELVPPEEN